MSRLLIFMKYPEPGKVKTRLAADIGDESAVAVYRACIEQTLANLKPLGSQAVVCFAPSERRASFEAWLGSDWALLPQHGADLGERLKHAFASRFELGDQPVVVIGTDSPWIESFHIEEAWQALRSHEMVIGPAKDGGYYLLGLKRPQPSLFEGIGWSGSRVRQETCAKASEQSLTVKQLQVHYDMDRITDLQRLVKDLGESPRYAALRRTLQCALMKVGG